MALYAYIVMKTAMHNLFPRFRASCAVAFCLVLAGFVWLLPAQIPDPAEVGPKIVTEAFGKLSVALGEALAKGGPAGALTVCQEKAPQIANETAAAHGVILRRVSLKPRNTKNSADEEERRILEMFQKALAEELAAKPVVISHEDGSRSFFAPILLANPLCLNCHGELGSEVLPATLEEIRRLYPADQATGYKLGELRGLWRVIFPPIQKP